jgi:hypothetical protein
LKVSEGKCQDPDPYQVRLYTIITNTDE